MKTKIMEINITSNMSKKDIEREFENAFKKIFEEKIEQKSGMEYLAEEMTKITKENIKMTEEIFDDSETEKELTKIFHTLKNENECLKGILRRRNRH